MFRLIGLGIVALGVYFVLTSELFIQMVQLGGVIIVGLIILAIVRGASSSRSNYPRRSRGRNDFAREYTRQMREMNRFQKMTRLEMEAQARQERWRREDEEMERSRVNAAFAGSRW